MKKIMQVGLIASAMHLVAGSALAASFMPAGELTSQPIGHFEFCQQHPSECKNKTSKPELVRLTPALWNKMQDVNNSINVMIEPITDEDQWNKEELWSFPVNKGDCEDYVLLKRKLLIEQGVPANNLLITVVRQKNGDGHAVLAIRTDRGDFILDNVEGKIKSWEKTGYRFLKRQSDNHAQKWVSIEDKRQTIVSSVTP
ncbi:MAG: transglutaminase-like cysteine peptidase [Rhizobiaceae bacterium]